MITHLLCLPTCALHPIFSIASKVREAVHCYVTAARLLPRFAAAHANLGALLQEHGKLGQGLAHLHQAIALDPALSEAYCNMGQVGLNEWIVCAAGVWWAGSMCV